MAVIAEAQITLSVMRDIKAVYWFYLLQGVNVSAPQPPSVFPPPSPWDDAEPDYDEGSTDRLYFVECTVFCDDTFDYSEVSLSSSYEAAKNAWNKANTALKNTITGVDVMYANHTSSTSAPTTGWSTTAPAWVDGKYMWQKTVTTFGDGETIESDPTCISGAKGSTGSAGKGISSVKEQYYRSTSATTQTGGSWSDTYPGWQDGTYIWTRTVISYTTGNPLTTTPICVTGSKGETGDPGDKGDTGTSVESIEVQYYLSTSKTTQTGGSWSSTMPSWSSGTYLWTRHKITYTNPSSTEYTNPKCDSSWEAMYEAKTEIDQTINSVSIKYYDSAGNETTFKLSDGALDLSFLKGQIDDAEKTATNFISITDTGGIEVGNKTNGNSWTGYRTQMLADSFNILNEAGAVLAKYGTTDIYLGNDNPNAVIHFCGDGATLSYDLEVDTVEIGGAGVRFECLYDDFFTTAFFKDGMIRFSYFYDDPYGAPVISNSTIEFDLKDSSIAFDGFAYGYIDCEEFWFTGKNLNLSTCDLNLTTQYPGETPGKIRGTTEGVSWFRGREAATLIATGGTGTSAYYPVIDTKCNTGDWSIGTLGDSLYFVYTTDSNYNAGNNTTTRAGVDYNGAFFSGASFFKSGYAHIYGTTGGGDMFFRSTNSTNGHSIGFGIDNNGTSRGIYDASRGHWTLCNDDTYTQMNAPGALYFVPHYGQSLNSSSRCFAVGVANKLYGPCLRPDANGWCTIGANGYGVKYIYATNTGIQSTSDVRLKENISADFSSLEKLFEMLRPVTYEYKHIEDDNDVRIGFIAQDVWSALETCGYDPRRFAAIHAEEVDPESDLKEYIDTDETYYLNYTEFTALNTYMIQKLMKRIEELEKRIA